MKAVVTVKTDCVYIKIWDFFQDRVKQFQLGFYSFIDFFLGRQAQIGINCFQARITGNG